MFQDYGQGGLKLIDLYTKKNLAAKCKWIELVERKEYIKPWFYVSCNIPQDKIWEYNIVARDIRDIQLNGFVKEVLQAWSEYNYEIPTEPKEIMNQIIYFNSNIKRANKVSIVKGMQEPQKIYQLFHECEKRMSTHEEIRDRYNTELTVLETNSIKSAIPVVRKQIVIVEEMHDIPNLLSAKSKPIQGKDLAKKIYRTVIEKQKSKDASKALWKKDLGLSIEQVEWEKILKSSFNISNYVTLRYFQYKILNRILKMKRQVAKWKEISPLCTFCQEKEETFLHLLWQCNETQKMWKLLQKWIRYFLQEKCNLMPELIIFNNYKGKSKKLIDTLILTMKRFIFVKKVLEQQVNFCAYLSEVNHMRKIERITTYQSNKMKTFYAKWNKYP